MYLPKLIEDIIKEYINIRIAKRNRTIKNIDFSIKTYKNCRCKHMELNRHYQKLMIYDTDDDSRYRWFQELSELLDKYGEECDHMVFNEYGDHSGFIYCLDPDFRDKLTESYADTIESFNYSTVRKKGRDEWDFIDEVYKKGKYSNIQSLSEEIKVINSQ
jgi:hypothetical protein